MHRIFLALCFWGSGVLASGDVLNLSNGDRYVGVIEIVNAKEVHLKSDVVGLLKVPRDKVASIYFGTNRPPVKLSSTLNEEAADSKLDAKAVDQVQKEFLATAGPEANAMFAEMVQGLASGKINVEDIRKQASDTLKELRELQGEGGDEENALLSSYVSILEKFIKSGPANKNSATNSPWAVPPKNARPPRALQPLEEE
jgi:hypothetical protein